jgi:hypothetical protein
MTIVRYATAAGLLAAVAMPGIASAGPYCQQLPCYTAECWWISAHHRRCRHVCPVRCYSQPEPQPYYPPPVYAQPEPDYTPTYARADQAPNPVMPLVILAGLIALIVGIIGAAIDAAQNNSATTDLAAPDADAAKNRELESEMQALLRKADQHIDDMLSKYRDGDSNE